MLKSEIIISLTNLDDNKFNAIIVLFSAIIGLFEKLQELKLKKQKKGTKKEVKKAEKKLKEEGSSLVGVKDKAKKSKKVKKRLDILYQT